MTLYMLVGEIDIAGAFPSLRAFFLKTFFLLSVKNFHLCLQFLRVLLMECGHHGNDVKVTDEDGFLSCSMMIKAENIIMKERIWIHRVDQRYVERDHAHFCLSFSLAFLLHFIQSSGHK